MRAGLAVVLVVATLPCALAAQAHDASTGASWSFRTLLVNRFIGPQEKEVGVVDAPVVSLTPSEWEPFSVAKCQQAQGALVVVDFDNAALWDLHTLLGLCTTLEECGARGVVKVSYSDRGVSDIVGYLYYATQHNCCKSKGGELGIPLLNAWHEDVHQFLQLAQSSNLTITIHHADTNPWLTDMFHNAWFIAFCRVLLPFVDICVGMIVLRALVLHCRAYVRAKAKRNKSLMDHMRALVIIATFLQLSGCCIRAAYCIVGPVMCNANLQVAQSMILVNLSLPIQVPVVLIVVVVFRRIVSLKRMVNPPDNRKVAVAAVVCLLDFLLEVYAGYRRGESNTNRFIFYSGVFVTFITVCALVLFLGIGVPFLRHMHRSHENEKQHTSGGGSHLIRRIRVRFAWSVVLSSVGLLVQLVSAVLFVTRPDISASPKGLPALFTVYYFSFTLTTLFQTLAFAPLTRLRVPQGIRNSIPQAFFPSFSTKKNSEPAEASPSSQVDAALRAASEVPEGQEEAPSVEHASVEWVWDDFEDEVFVLDPSEHQARGTALLVAMHLVRQPQSPGKA